jgi:hypothetical protein
MKYFDTIFHLLTGGLEFLEISAKLKDDFQLENLEPSLKTFATYNNIHIFIVKTMPKMVIGKDIYIHYNAKNHCVYLKALHSYYDGVSISRFFMEIDNIYKGNAPSKPFHFKTPITNYYGNKMVELGANVLMNKIDSQYDENNACSPYATYENISSGDLIRKVQEKADLDMIMLISKSKLNGEENNMEMKNNLTFRYVKKGEDFKRVLKNSGTMEQSIRFATWLAKKNKVLFFNNLSNMQLPSFIERLVCFEEKEKSSGGRLLTLVAYPRTSDGVIEIYMG